MYTYIHIRIYDVASYIFLYASSSQSSSSSCIIFLFFFHSLFISYSTTLLKRAQSSVKIQHTTSCSAAEDAPTSRIKQLSRCISSSLFIYLFIFRIHQYHFNILLYTQPSSLPSSLSSSFWYLFSISLYTLVLRVICNCTEGAVYFIYQRYYRKYAHCYWSSSFYSLLYHYVSCMYIIRYIFI